jgi:two-component system, NarL family, sensor kinase
VAVGRRGIAMVVTIALAAAAVAVAAVAVRLASPSTGVVIPTSGFPASGVLVQPLPGASTPLRAGDLVTAIADRSIGSWADTWLSPGDDLQPRVGETVPIDVERGGTPATFNVPLATFPALEVLAPAIGTLSFVFAMLLIGVVVFALRPAVPASGALLLAGVGAAGSTIPFLLGSDPLDLATGSYAAGQAATSAVYLLLWAGLVDFLLVFPRPLEAVARRPALRLVPYAGMLLGYAVALGALRPGAPSTLAWLGSWPPVSLLPPVVTFVLIPLLLAVRWRRAPADERRLLRGFSLVIGFIVVANAVIWIVPEAITGQPLIPWSVGAVIGLPFPVLVAASIVRHRAFDIDVVVRRSLVYGGLTLVVIATYALTAAVLGAALGGGSGFASSLLATGVAAVVALPVRDVLQRGASRFVYGDRDQPVQAIRRLGERLALVADPALLPRVVVDTVAEALRLPFVALELDSGTALPVTAERGVRPATNEVVARPLTSRGRGVGRLLVSPRGPSDPLSAADLRLLDDLCREVAVAADAARLTADLRASRERIVTGREEERRRLRRDLHDGLGPALAGIGMRAEAAQALVVDDPAAANRLLDELRSESAQAVGEVRRLVDGLRPPAIDEVGLAGALRIAAERLRAPGGPDVVVEGDDRIRALPAAVEVAAYRIGTEALINAVHHAEATTVRLRLEAGRDLTIAVDDDGRGLADERRDGVGLSSMRERAAELGGAIAIEPRPGGGTRVVARLPLPGAAGT